MVSDDYNSPMKKCTMCGELLPETPEYFFRTKSGKNGLVSQCKKCRYAIRASQFKDTPCPICGGKVLKRNGMYCSNECNGIGMRGIVHPGMLGRTPWSKGLTNDTDERIARISETKRKDGVVDKDTLTNLYVERNLTLREIGDMYGVSHWKIRQLVNEFGLERKRDKLTQELVEELYASGMSFADIGHEYECSPAYVRQNFGMEIEARRYKSDAGASINKETLRSMYWNEWLTYHQIAEILNVDFTAIPYWLKKFDIPTRTVWETRRGKDWQEPDPKAIVALYTDDGLGMDVIGKIFGVSISTIRPILESQGIEIRDTRFGHKSTAKDGHAVRSGLELLVDNWLYRHGIPHGYEPKLRGTRYKSDFIVGDIYIEVWGMMERFSYREKHNKKLAVYKKLGLNLISLYPSDFPSLAKLEVLLKNSL
jgi:hypothetical protein